ncbi:hypothetical protein [Actinoplanes sp. N902-109]|uniref:hypothetical protein n=1 Tax=Actinoplanes sp. (strain N902-109) TaxID=649831 RepID=UPI0003295686|nr:hypothetical protein [Actinoplanes sp. N902-109]AGL18142.1 hypothetical protein L083_4632 [Actinoplanes sp. N902-109]
MSRYIDAAMIANYLTAEPAHRCGCTTEQRDRIVQRYLAVLEQPGWRDAACSGLDPAGEFFTWFASHVAARLRPGAVTGPAADDER